MLELHDAVGAPPNSAPAKRHGSAKSPGREFAIALTAAELLGRSGLHVLSWRPGRSADAARIASIPLIARFDVALDDADEPRAAGPAGVNVVDVDRVAADAYDVVIASEIVQTLRDPAAGLAAILRAAGRRGLVVLTTDLHDGSPVRSLGFARARDHRWFWTIDAVAHVARSEGFLFDVRLPEIAVQRKLRRKRYVYLSQDPDTMQRVRTHFGTQFRAPSEWSQ